MATTMGAGLAVRTQEVNNKALILQHVSPVLDQSQKFLDAGPSTMFDMALEFDGIDLIVLFENLQASP